MWRSYPRAAANAPPERVILRVIFCAVANIAAASTGEKRRCKALEGVTAPAAKPQFIDHEDREGHKGVSASPAPFVPFVVFVSETDGCAV